MNKLTVSQKAFHELQRKAKESNTAPKLPKRDNIFSQSRDTREDRDTRQMKTTRKATTLPQSK
jgi:hypothetical protein